MAIVSFSIQFLIVSSIKVACIVKKALTNV